jgi:hypothetical protein
VTCKKNGKKFNFELVLILSLDFGALKFIIGEFMAEDDSD